MARLTPLQYLMPAKVYKSKKRKKGGEKIPVPYVPPPAMQKKINFAPADYLNWLSRKHGEHIDALVASYESMGVKYIQWQSTGDDRVRSTHSEIDGEIVRVGTRFSNGLLFPGDYSHYKPEETVNCRCTAIPFWIPEGYMAISDRFRVGEIVKVRNAST